MMTCLTYRLRVSLFRVMFIRVAEGAGFNDKTMKLFLIKIVSVPGLFLHCSSISPQVLFRYVLKIVATLSLVSLS